MAGGLMPSQRLTKQMREAVLARVKASAFALQKDVLRAELVALGDDAYARYIPPPVQALLAKLPPEWVASTSIAQFKLPGGFNADLPLSAPQYWPPLFARDWTRRPMLAADHLERWRAIEAARERIKRDTLALVADVERAMAPHRTVAQLLDAWPEAAALIPSSAPPRALPAVIPDALNERLATAGVVAEREAE